MHGAAALPRIEAVGYRPHLLHSPERTWVEKNCYVDIWIELIHAFGMEPLAMLPFTVAIDFDGDQWTFFKPPHEDLRFLYGIGVQELYVWRPLIEHAVEHLGAGKFISTEADAFWLPDTAGTDYREKHTKTTIVLTAVDVDAQRLDYFHNAGFFSLEGRDFVETFRLAAAPDPAYMPLFAELVRRDRSVHRDADELRSASALLLRKHVEWLPLENPVRRFQQRLDEEWPAIVRQGLPFYHAWVFGTLRQLGAAAELSALYLSWLEPGAARLEPAVEAFTQLSNISKSMILKTARAVHAGRRLDAAAGFEDMTAAADVARSVLRSLA